MDDDCVEWKVVPLNFMLQKIKHNIDFSADTPWADAAVLLALTDEVEPHILLTRRATQLREHAGEVSLPGGKREMQDKDNTAVALRETEEETALAARHIQLVGELPLQQSKSGLNVRPIVGIIPTGLALQAQQDEIARIFFMPLTHFIHAPMQPYKVRYQQQDFYFPSVHYDGEIVWGLTARILVSLLQQGLHIEKQWPFLLSQTTAP